MILFFAANNAFAQQINFAGSYEMLLCVGDCSIDEPDKAYIKGHLVIFDEPLDKDTLELYWADFEATLGNPPTACFFFEQLKERSQSFAGIIENGTTTWTRSEGSDAIEFTVYRSADGRTIIVGTFTGKQFKGKVITHHMGQLTASDTITARRIGKPDVKLCVP